MTPEDLSKRIVSTYFSLRMGMGIIALIFPSLLWVAGWIFHDLPLQGSMSAYYFAIAGNGYMRDYFVGILFALGVMLFLYKGFTQVEDYVLNIAGVLALGIAVFPMNYFSVAPPPFHGKIHGFCAILFFLCIAYICVFHADDTLSLLEEELVQAQYRRTYKTLGILMVVAPLTALILFSTGHRTFFAEAFGVWVFATYWLVKSREINRTEADEKAAKGSLVAIKKGTGSPKHVPTKDDNMMDELTKNEVTFVPQDIPKTYAKISIKDQIFGNISIQEK